MANVAGRSHAPLRSEARKRLDTPMEVEARERDDVLAGAPGQPTPGRSIRGCRMMSGVAIDQLRARVAAAATRSKDGIDRSTSLCAAARRSCVWAERTRMEAQARRDCRTRPALDGIEGFRVDGLIDGQPVTAVSNGEGLECPPELLARAELLVDLRETFGGGDLPYVTASLTDGPTAMFLTVLRAMSVVHSVELRPRRSGAALPACRDPEY